MRRPRRIWQSERARYALADITAKRWVALRKNHAVSEQSISVQEANAKAEAAKVRASEQNVRNFEALIRFKTIVAPYDGVVIDRNINVGDYVNKEGTISGNSAVSNLFTVADVTMLRLFVSVPESFGPFLQSGHDGRRDGAAIAQSSFHRQIPDCRPRIRREHAHRDHRLHDRQRGQSPLAGLLCQGRAHGAGR